MLYREIIAVSSQIHTKYIKILCGQNVELYIKTQSVPLKAARLPRTQEFSNQSIFYRFIDLLHCNIITYMYSQYYCTNYCKRYGIPECTRY